MAQRSLSPSLPLHTHLRDREQQAAALDGLAEREAAHREHHDVPEEAVEVVLGEHAKAEERDCWIWVWV